MFGLFSSPDKRARDEASPWLETATNVWHYRRDVLKEADAKELLERRDLLKGLLKEKAKAPLIEGAVKKLTETLERTGGVVYPRGGIAENVEFFVMAALVILGFRTYFFGNFEIPTNSMWPTYYGMTPEVFNSPAQEPSEVKEAFRRVALGASPYRIDSPTDGELLIPVFGSGAPRYRLVDGRSWLVFPAKKREYTLIVGDTPVTLQVPSDFDFDWVVFDAFLGKGGHYGPENMAMAVNTANTLYGHVTGNIDGQQVTLLRTGLQFKKGQRLLSFDVVSGDKLFVDRISYNFVHPPVGSGFVFRTGHIPLLAAHDGDVFFVKRLVGLPGDTLQVKGTRLYRNGAPITGSPAFEANAMQTGLYPGYTAIQSLAEGETFTVPAHGFFAMGDNSPNSYDSRYWGAVPEKDVVGRPVFVYYPFTRRFGLAK